MYVYALYNQTSKKIYIGQTANLEKRLTEHNEKRGNHFTAKVQGGWKLIYNESVATRSEALRREKQLKSFRGREFIKTHIPEHSNYLSWLSIRRSSAVERDAVNV